MSTFLGDLSLPQLAWLLVVNHIVHLLEEAPRFVGWANQNLNLRDRHYTQRKFNLENALLLAYGLVVAVLLGVFPADWFLQLIVLGGAIGFLSNTWFHASHTLRNGIYSPGLVTACLFNPALFGVVFWKAGQAGLLTIPSLLVGLLFGLGMLPLAVIFTHRVLLKNDQ